MASTKIIFDTTDFDNHMRNIVRVIIPSIAQRAMTKVCDTVITDSVKQIPTVPLRDSFLRGSGTGWVNNDLAAKSRYGVVDEETVTKRHRPPVSEPVIPVLSTVGIVAFTKHYAAYQHEGVSRTSGRPLHYRVPGAGAKYLTKTLYSNVTKYVNLLQNEFTISMAYINESNAMLPAFSPGTPTPTF